MKITLLFGALIWKEKIISFGEEVVKDRRQFLLLIKIEFKPID